MKIGKMKGGGKKVAKPGSRGGKVVGTRANGDPIYASQVKGTGFGPPPKGKAAVMAPLYKPPTNSPHTQPTPTTVVRARHAERAAEHQKSAAQAMLKGDYKTAHMHVDAAVANGLPKHAGEAIKIAIRDHERENVIAKETAAAQSRGAGATLLAKMSATPDQKWDAYQARAAKVREKNSARLKKRWGPLGDDG